VKIIEEAAMSEALSRRDAMALGLAAGAVASAGDALAADAPILRRAIPKSGEKLPAVGLGTAVVFDSAQKAALTDVVKTLVADGGRVLDTAPSYGEAESVTGDILAATGLRKSIFLATKLERYDRAQGLQAFRASLQSLHADTVDLLQLHNVNDPQQDLSMLRMWKDMGLCRYVGITTTSKRSYDAAVSIIKREKPDFVQVDYALDNRDAEERVLPTAADNGVAVLTALPFGRGRLFRDVRDKPMPDWAKDFGTANWAQFFVKYLLGNPAVTCVIPGTASADHMADNLNAGRGPMPNAAQRAQMARYADSI
jgi:aryl-alcohol dehydrogenase-like predicted oxidoreductase